MKQKSEADVIPAKLVPSMPREQESILDNMKTYFVYILASKKNSTLYIGVTSNLIKRVHEHKNDLTEGFTKKYRVHTLVYFEQTPDVNEAILREKRIKKWKRQRKIDLIEKENLRWRDLYRGLV